MSSKQSLQLIREHDRTEIIAMRITVKTKKLVLVVERKPLLRLVEGSGHENKLR